MDIGGSGDGLGRQLKEKFGNAGKGDLLIIDTRQ